VGKNDGMSIVLDDMFLISGFIPRQTLYEVGLRRGIRYKAAVGPRGRRPYSLLVRVRNTDDQMYKVSKSPSSKSPAFSPRKVF